MRNEKESVIDVKAVDETGKQYDIEVQVSGNETFIRRTLYYWAKLYAGQLSSGKGYQTLKPTICISLLNHSIIENDSLKTLCLHPVEAMCLSSPQLLFPYPPQNTV